MSNAKNPDPEQSPSQPTGADRRIPEAVIRRLSLYSRVLQVLERQGIEKISSTELGERLGFNSAQVRKDLAYFGQFGVPGFGYPVQDLRNNIKRILGTDREIRVALIGVGHLGTALLSYDGFRKQGFLISVAFDLFENLEGVGAMRVPIFHINQLERRLEEFGVEFVMLAVNPEAAQGIADRLTATGISAILNFVPVRLRVPSKVRVHDVDLAIEMESLSFYLK